MNAPAGSTLASELPKSLSNILDVLMKENGLQSWQVFRQKRGVSLRLKFGETQNGCQPKTITESADKQDIVMDPNSSTPMEGCTRVGDITAHISDQDSDSCGEVTSD